MTGSHDEAAMTWVGTFRGFRGERGCRTKTARRARAAVAVLAMALILDFGCAAPSSNEIRGPVADQVRASIRSGRAAFDGAPFGRLLENGTRDGLADYRFFREHRGDLDAWLNQVAEADFSSLAPSHLEALLINAYNGLTIRSILEHPGVKSIREIDGVWDRIKHRVGRRDLTLDELEHNILRPFFKDPRIHFAVNCASKSCAPLAPFAYDGETLADQLEGRAKLFLTDPRNVRVDEGVLLLSKYFDWYGKDFTAPGWSPRADSIALFVTQYAGPDVVRFIEAAGGRPTISFFDYDWSLNAAPER